MICPRCGQINVPGDDVCRRCQFSLAPLDLPIAHDQVESSLLDDEVGSVPPRPPVTLPLTATVKDAMTAMIEAHVGAVLVCDEDGHLAGIFTERDLLVRVAGLDQPFNQLPISAFMTADPETVSARDPLAFALHKMDVGGYRHLPVVNLGKPEGILSVRDLVQHLTRLCSDAS